EHRDEELADRIADPPWTQMIEQRQLRDVEAARAVARRVRHLHDGVDREQAEDDEARGDDLAPRHLEAEPEPRLLGRCAWGLRALLGRAGVVGGAADGRAARAWVAAALLRHRSELG